MTKRFESAQCTRNFDVLLFKILITVVGFFTGIERWWIVSIIGIEFAARWIGAPLIVRHHAVEF